MTHEDFCRLIRINFDACYNVEPDQFPCNGRYLDKFTVTVSHVDEDVEFDLTWEEASALYSAIKGKIYEYI